MPSGPAGERMHHGPCQLPSCRHRRLSNNQATRLSAQELVRKGTPGFQKAYPGSPPEHIHPNQKETFEASGAVLCGGHVNNCHLSQHALTHSPRPPAPFAGRQRCPGLLSRWRIRHHQARREGCHSRRVRRHAGALELKGFPLPFSPAYRRSSQGEAFLLQRRGQGRPGPPYPLHARAAAQRENLFRKLCR